MFLLNVKLINCFRKRTRIISRFWEVHHDSREHKPSCRSVLPVGTQRAKNNRNKEIQLCDPMEASGTCSAAANLPLNDIRSKRNIMLK